MLGLYLDLILGYTLPMSSDLSYRDPAVLADLLETMNDEQIGQKFGVTSRTICYWRHRAGLAFSAIPSRGNTKYSTNRDFFEHIDTPAKAYVLGFVLADGTMHRDGRTVTIALKESDADHLRVIADLLDSDTPIRRKVGVKPDGSPRALAVLYLCGRKLVSDLDALGVRHGKSVTATYPRVAGHLERHLMRGLFDGDGYIGPRQFSLVGTDALVGGATAAVLRHTGRALQIRRGWRGHLYAVGYRKDRDVLSWMYSDGAISLERKAEAFRLYWNQAPRT